MTAYRDKRVIGEATLYLGDCLDILPTLGKVDAVITDPPYGCNKAEWDSDFPTEWYALVNARFIVLITGSSGLRDSVALVGDEFVDVIAARNMNGMTRGPIGFGNWLAAVVARGKPRQGINAFDFSISSEMPNHPSPKPIEYMTSLVGRVTEKRESILDPFMGSGTTGVACMQLGRKFIGIEICEKYYEIAVERITNARRQQPLFNENLQQVQAEQIALGI